LTVVDSTLLFPRLQQHGCEIASFPVCSSMGAR